jgi:hypothetical protein
MTANIEAEINRAASLVTQLEHLVYNKSKEGKLVVIGKDDDLLMGYWSLVFDFGKGIGCLLHHEFYSAASLCSGPWSRPSCVPVWKVFWEYGKQSMASAGANLR